MNPVQLALPGRRFRPKKAPPAPERRTQIALADLLRLDAAPGLVWTHLPFGEYRSDATAALLKRMGVSPGWPDFLFIDGAGRVAFLELKRAGGRLNAAQAAFGAVCRSRDIPHAVCHSFTDAADQLAAWGLLRGRVKLSP